LERKDKESAQPVSTYALKWTLFYCQPEVVDMLLLEMEIHNLPIMTLPLFHGQVKSGANGATVLRPPQET
jgi:hypothetical protein